MLEYRAERWGGNKNGNQAHSTAIYPRVESPLVYIPSRSAGSPALRRLSIANFIHRSSWSSGNCCGIGGLLRSEHEYVTYDITFVPFTDDAADVRSSCKAASARVKFSASWEDE
jgi:hypothetical protein